MKAYSEMTVGELEETYGELIFLRIDCKEYEIPAVNSQMDEIKAELESRAILSEA